MTPQPSVSPTEFRKAVYEAGVKVVSAHTKAKNKPVGLSMAMDWRAILFLAEQAVVSPGCEQIAAAHERLHSTRHAWPTVGCHVGQSYHDDQLACYSPSQRIEAVLVMRCRHREYPSRKGVPPSYHQQRLLGSDWASQCRLGRRHATSDQEALRWNDCPGHENVAPYQAGVPRHHQGIRTVSCGGQTIVRGLDCQRKSGSVGIGLRRALASVGYSWTCGQALPDWPCHRPWWQRQ